MDGTPWDPCTLPQRLALADPDCVHHEQPEMTDEQLGQVTVADLRVGHVQPETRGSAGRRRVQATGYYS
jgi:hypothetical protein